MEWYDDELRKLEALEGKGFNVDLLRAQVEEAKAARAQQQMQVDEEGKDKEDMEKDEFKSKSEFVDNIQEEVRKLHYQL